MSVANYRNMPGGIGNIWQVLFRFRFRTFRKRMPLEPKISAAARKQDVDRCSLCKNPVVKGFGANSYFGLIDGCHHSFCLPCIRQYRDEILISSVTSQPDCQHYVPNPAPCPVCKAPFNYIMASKRWISDTKQKEKFLKEFKKNSNSIRCNFFNRGFGSCVSATKPH